MMLRDMVVVVAGVGPGPGLPRTGTTALHRLLVADPAHQGLELWLAEARSPGR